MTDSEERVCIYCQDVMQKAMRHGHEILECECGYWYRVDEPRGD